ncbi:MAG: glycosyltransferase family 1 protein [Treponema sp.]|nr:glycosyltransferase family 1 protein [Treponema sp.]
MRVALVHYHLRRGGVSSVIRHQARSLMDAGVDVLLITGEDAPEDAGFPCVRVENLDYDKPEDREALGDGALREKAAGDLAAGILAAMENRWGEAADIVHVHNPLIQKNTLLIPALNILRSRGLRLLLQNHDLAEDFRPDVYAGYTEYPENCHYAVINSRDHSYLRHSGLKPEGLHLIPNEVAVLGASPGIKRTRYLYPVRAIRRKNIGEALLLSLYIPPNRSVAITLPPAEKDSRAYRRWMGLASELELPMEFALGKDFSLEYLLGSAVCALSTSIKEGFGFSFLEPWTAGRGLVGRRIDYVCKDFESAGVNFDSLYSEIKIPLEYVSLVMLRNKMESAIRRVYRAFGLEVPVHIMRLMTEELGSRDTLDFGRLDEEFQESIIRTLCNNRTAFRDVAALNPFLGGLADWREDEALIKSNRQIIREYYGRERISKILMDTYRAVMDHPVVHKISKPVLLDLYLNPLRFSLVDMDG